MTDKIAAAERVNFQNLEVKTVLTVCMHSGLSLAPSKIAISFARFTLCCSLLFKTDSISFVCCDPLLPQTNTLRQSPGMFS